MSRYTPPDLSRQLAESFTDRDSRDFSSSGAWWRFLHLSPPSLVTGTVERPRCHERNGEADLQAVRALDLTDVLGEIRRIAPTADLSIHTCDIGWACQMWPSGTSTWAGEIPTFEAAHPESVVEAAGLALLAMMKDRQ